jgi:dihydropteroate synthase
MIWQTSRFRIDLSQARVMGIVNITPDSFSDGGRHASAAAAIAHCERLVKEGADILDLGGESSRPGATALPLDEEFDRVLPVLSAALSMGVAVSIDTYKPELMRAALDAGVDIVNDIFALRAPQAIDVVAAHPNCGICLMHMQGEPQSMQAAPAYGDVVEEVKDFLSERARLLGERGVQADRIVLDPGIGFGKTAAHNLALLSRQRELLDCGYPLLLGWSRKNTLGLLTGKAVDERMAASVAAALAAVQQGAKVIRVHDVAATVDALKVWRAAGFDADVTA